jgi:spore coat polysaccharide biosynthesis protein SpsF
MSALAVVQARMSSTRLPGKVLTDVCGEPMLELLLARLGRATLVERIVVATSDQPSDDAIAEAAEAARVAVHRGPLADVLARVVGAVGSWDGPVVRITADCPFTDPGVVDSVVALYERTPGCAYASNIDPRVHPDGLDVEVVAADALRAVAAEAGDEEAREHVTPAIRREPERFPPAALDGDRGLAGLRWTVDEEADLDFVRQVAARLGEGRYTAGPGEIGAAVRQEPSLAFHGGFRRG